MNRMVFIFAVLDMHLLQFGEILVWDAWFVLSGSLRVLLLAARERFLAVR